MRSGLMIICLKIIKICPIFSSVVVGINEVLVLHLKLN